MRYIAVSSPGAADVMSVAETEKPAVREHEVLIRVRAAGVNRPDVAQRQGLYPPPPDASPILGLEVAGTIEQVGKQVDQQWLTKNVCALVNGGGYAEYVAVPVSQCLPIPDGLTMVEAAALPETFFTVWSNVFDRAKLQANETFLVHGGSSGIGSTAIQLAKAFGARVYTTAGSEEKCDFCRRLGADLAINYREQDFVEVIQQDSTAPSVNVVLDMIGGSYIQKNIQLAALDGRIVNIAFLGGAKAEVNFAPAMMKRLILTGSTLRPRSAEYKGWLAQELLTKVWPLIAAGSIRPEIAATYPLEKATDAHQLMESSQHMGKIVLTLE